MKTELVDKLRHYEKNVKDLSGSGELEKTLRMAACRLEELETMASLTPVGISLEDSSAHIIFNYSQKGDVSTQTRYMCPKCRCSRLRVRYHEDRLYGVICDKCKTLTLVKAGNPFKATEIVAECRKNTAAN